VVVYFHDTNLGNTDYTALNTGLHETLITRIKDELHEARIPLSKEEGSLNLYDALSPIGGEGAGG
jgi:hypothetical protein